MMNLIERLLSKRVSKFMPWYLFGIVIGTSTYMGVSGISAVFSIFLISTLLSCVLKSYFDYVVDPSCNFVIDNVHDYMDSQYGSNASNDEFSHTRRTRIIYTISAIFNIVALCALILIISFAVNSIIFLNIDSMAVSMAYVVIAVFTYYIITFLQNVNTLVSYRKFR